MTGLDVALATAASAAIFSVFVRRWARAGQHHRLPVAAGALLIVLSVLVGIWQLPTDRAPKGEPESIGVVPGIESRSADGNGLTAGLGVEVDDCGDRPEVTFVANGSVEYWRRYGSRFSDVSHFQVALPGTDLEDVRVGMSDDATVVQFPTTAKRQEPKFLRDVTIRERDGVTIVTGAVGKWSKHLNSVVVQFRPDWLEKRSIGTCYLRLPALTGGRTVLAAQIARGPLETARPGQAVIRSERTGRVAIYEPWLETTFASATVVIEGGDILAEESRPSPDTTFEGHPAWVCETRPPRSVEIDEDRGGRTPDILSGSSTAGAVYSREYTRDTRGTDCDGIAVITENSAGTKRDLLLLGLGATVSLGAAILVETLLGPAGAITRGPGQRGGREGGRRPRRRRLRGRRGRRGRRS